MNGRTPPWPTALDPAELTRHARIMNTSWDRWPVDLRRHVALTPGARQHPERLPAAVAAWIASPRQRALRGGR